MYICFSKGDLFLHIILNSFSPDNMLPNNPYDNLFSVFTTKFRTSLLLIIFQEKIIKYFKTLIIFHNPFTKSFFLV